ncbi:50S ribosomal protein L10, partial [Candidatus Shapirobacteria bacterium CG10_big_fil_rev_8_21_14_0_10_40_9]
MKKQEKIFAVQDLKERLKEAKAVILTDYRGLTVPQMNDLRLLVKKAGGQILVVKNTLLER